MCFIPNVIHKKTWAILENIVILTGIPKYQVSYYFYLTLPSEDADHTGVGKMSVRENPQGHNDGQKTEKVNTDKF